jgi:hypothetical protein
MAPRSTASTATPDKLPWQEKTIPAEGSDNAVFYDNVFGVIRNNEPQRIDPVSVREVIRVVQLVRKGTKFPGKVKSSNPQLPPHPLLNPEHHMAHEQRIGLVGLDTSHVIAFTKLLNVVEEKDHIPGARVIAGWPGGSQDIDVSKNRVDGFTKDLKEKYGRRDYEHRRRTSRKRVTSSSSPPSMGAPIASSSNASRRSRSLCSSTKPFTTSLADAKAIFDLADKNNMPVMSCSSLRYADGLSDMLEKGSDVIGCDAFGPMDIISQLPATSGTACMSSRSCSGSWAPAASR